MSVQAMVEVPAPLYSRLLLFLSQCFYDVDMLLNWPSISVEAQFTNELKCLPWLHSETLRGKNSDSLLILCIRIQVRRTVSGSVQAEGAGSRSERLVVDQTA